MRVYVDEALAESRAGSSLPFVTIDRESNRVIGSTRVANIDRTNRHVEIGWTWITPSFQRTYVNSEAKYLMLRHAFEEWECARVELKTDVLNYKSRNALLRRGATEVGTLLKLVLAYNDRWRDTIYYSVLDTEWPEVKARLELFLSR
jgi:RimJ/RimL family protein N-acetyltransferase